MTVLTHKLFGTDIQGINLVNNGGFTAVANKWQPLENTYRQQTELVDTDKYRRHRLGFVAPEAQALGHWTLSGPRCGITVNPVDSNGFDITSVDGGNVLKISFMESGEFILEQEMTDVKRFYGAHISMACGGIHMVGSPVVKLTFVVDDAPLNVATASATAFGTHRRFGDYITLPPTVSKLVLRVSVVGAIGEEVGLTGICAILGHQIKNAAFFPSLLDLLLPSGIVFMVAGESCPPAYLDLDDARMVLVGSSTGVQSFEHAAVTEIGFDEHDHSNNRVDAIRAPVVSETETTTPLQPTQTKLTMAADFHRYPATVVFNPYPGELPVTVLGPNHTHSLQSKMPHVPPTFPVRFCVKM